MYKPVNCAIPDEISRLILVAVTNEVLFTVLNIMILWYFYNNTVSHTVFYIMHICDLTVH